jgi:membrane associated rhomboid family serine protease
MRPPRIISPLSDDRGGARWLRLFLLGLVILCSGIELALQLSDRGLLLPLGLRAFAYDNAAFWPPLLRGWQPNYALQPWTMFFSYAVLHGGAWHLIFNMLTLWSLGLAVEREDGPWGVVGLLVAGSLGGAAAQGLLSAAPNPMVGLSGALFGLVGGLVWNRLRDARAGLVPTGAVWRIVLVLVAINLVMWWALDGRLAWQAHLGGTLAGLANAAGRRGLSR